MLARRIVEGKRGAKSSNSGLLRSGPARPLLRTLGLMNGSGRGWGRGGGSGVASAQPPTRLHWMQKGRGGVRGGRVPLPRGVALRRFPLARDREGLGDMCVFIGCRQAGRVSSEWEGAVVPPIGTLIHDNFFFFVLSPPDLASGGCCCC